MRLNTTQILVYAAVMLLAACKEEKTMDFDIASLPSDWVRLTEKDKKLIIYNSCDGGNLLMGINNNEGRNTLLLHGQQEDIEFDILKSSKRADTILFDSKWEDSDEYQVFKFIWIDEEKGLGRWITTYYDGQVSDFTFVTSEKQNEFEKQDQPCRECWGDECDEIEVENPNLINIEKESKIKFGDYILTYNGTNISLCCHTELHNPFGGYDKLTIREYLTDFELKIDTTAYSYNFIYSKNESSFEVIEPRPEKSGEEETFIGRGKLLDRSVTLPNGVKIGMDKTDFLDKYFIYPERTVDRLVQIAVCEDERGELFTKYKFKEGKLIEIEFGSIDEK